MKRSIIKLAAFIIVSILSIPVIFSQTESGLCLGKLQFIDAPKEMALDARTVKMKMAVKDKEISPYFCDKIGGIAFTQTAEPEFEVKSFSLICDKDSNAAYALINGSKYKIPLDVWQLQPIAKYADDENNAAVTIYGKENAKILFHEAFIDNLIGIRLLHTDLLFAKEYINGLLDKADLSKLPSKNGEYIISKSEKSKLEQDSTKSTERYNSINSIYNDFIIINSIYDEIYSTYIFTDFEEPIRFYIDSEDILKIKGYPYYRFYSKTPVIDTMRTYYETLSFLNDLNGENYIYDKSSILSKIEKIVHTEKTDSIKAKNVLKEYSRFAKKDIDFINLLSNGINKYLEKLNDEDLKKLEMNKMNTSLYSNCDTELCILYNFYIYLFSMDPNNSSLINIKKKAARYLNDPHYLKDPIYNLYHASAKYKYSYSSQTTQYLKNYPYGIRVVNPIVFDAAYATCQWSAFFRYAKQENPQNWESFLKQVKELEYDAPKVNTPTGFKVKD